MADTELLGIPKLEREGERVYQMCEQRAAIEAPYSNADTYMMTLELLLRKSLYNRLDAILGPDLSREQIQSLRVSFFANFFRLGHRGHTSPCPECFKQSSSARKNSVHT